MTANFSQFCRIFTSVSLIGAGVSVTVAQTAQERQFIEQSSGGWGFSILIVLMVAVAGAGFFFWKKATSKANTALADDGRYDSYYNSNDSYEMEGIDVDQDLEWLRKMKSAKAAKRQTKQAQVQPPKAFSRTTGVMDIDTRMFQEKMRKIQYSQLPINSFLSLRPAKMYEPLPYSEDPALLSAIEQANEEFEEDEVVRELALKILTAFRTRNSVESLTQIALYDLSSNLRSKAVSTLTDFDHPSVFEPILLACADPTREVRAAAARGLFRLSFDRADAWKRIAETNDEFRMRHAARAAIESGIAVKSFDRLVHEDLKVAQEAFSLVAFMIAADETDEIFKAIRNNNDERVRFALLHVLSVKKDERTLAKLEELVKISALSPDVAERLNETIGSLQAVMA